MAPGAGSTSVRPRRRRHRRGQLERYKRGFALDGQYDYFTGERILSPGRYEELLEAHRRRLAANGLDFDEASDFFPAYRRGAEALSPTEPVVRQTAEARS